MSKQLNSRVSHKHDTEANWLKATSFVPLAGEQIIYDADDTHPLPRVKIGDGTTLVSDLPFAVKNTTPNWKASEGEDGYIENRTHWKETVVVLPETTVQYVRPTDGNRLMIIDPASETEVEIGKTYIVTWNGTEYECEAALDGLGDGYSTLGNTYLLYDSGENNTWPDSGEPFLIWTLGTNVLISAESDSEVTFSIRAVDPIIHKLPNEYLDIPLVGSAVDVLPEMTIEGVEGSIDILTPFASEIVVGKTYTVTYNGTDYTCTAFPIQEGEGAPIMPSVGNQAAIGGEDTGEPFVIAYVPPEMLEMVGAYGIVMDMTGASSATVKIQGEAGVKIAKEALPTPNWNAKEGEDGYIENRTHWKEEGLIDYFPQTAISGNGVQYIITTPFAQQIVEGETYTVTIDGVDYVSEAKTVINEGVKIVILGNTSITGGEDSGEPYGLVIIPPEMVETAGGAYGMLVADTGGASEVTLRIWKDGTIYHKLAPEYLPIPMTGGAVDVLPETTIELGPGESSAEFDIIEPLAYKIEIGKQYKVTHNGAVFTCTAKEMDLSEGAGEMFTPALGNLSMIPGNESQESIEPFVFFQIPSEMYEEFGFYAVLLQTEEAHSAVIGIQSIDSVKIDNSALDMDWVAKYDNVGETIVAETVGKGINAEVAATDTSFFVEGAAFIAYVDNVRYDLTVKSYTEGTSQTLYAGNLGLVTADAQNTGEPFYIIAGDGKLTFFRAWTDDNDDLHTIAVYLPGSSQRVPNQKIPDDFLSGTDVYYVDLADGEVNRNFDEIRAAYELGRTVCCREFDSGITQSDIYYLTRMKVYGGEAHFAGIINGKMTEIKIENYNPDVGKNNYVTRTTIDLVALSDLTPKCTTISIPSASWTGDTNPYSQVVTVNGATANSKIDLQPTAAQIVQLQDADIALMAENNNGVITVYAIGGKPATDLTMQVLITEVQVV